MKVRNPSWSPVDDALSPTRTMLLRRAAYDQTIMFLRLTDDSIVPGIDDVRRLVESVRDDRRVERIRTSALFPKSAEQFAAAGFTPADTLSLLRADLASRRLKQLTSGRRQGAATRIGTMRRWNYGDAARVDRAAFGASWGHDAAELDDIRTATPRHRARYRYDPGQVFERTLRAFAVAGASLEHGYLQRLSVDPDHQRRGHGRQLTIDALRWMTRQRLPDCLVNTSVDNTGALALYESVGFMPMREHLRVMQLDVHATA